MYLYILCLHIENCFRNSKNERRIQKSKINDFQNQNLQKMFQHVALQKKKKKSCQIKKKSNTEEEKFNTFQITTNS